jgi:hypothetical protein
MKPLYRQNSHYIGKSMTSRLTYRLVTKSVPCRLDSTYRLENLGGHQAARKEGNRSRAPGGTWRREQGTNDTRGREQGTSSAWGSRRWHCEGQAWEMWAGDVGWFCCSVGTKVSRKMGFWCCWADWADMGKQVGRLMHACQPQINPSLQVVSKSPYLFRKSRRLSQSVMLGRLDD